MTVGELVDRLVLYNRNMEVSIETPADSSGVEDILIEDPETEGGLPLLVLVSDSKLDPEAISRTYPLKT